MEVELANTSASHAADIKVEMDDIPVVGTSCEPPFELSGDAKPPLDGDGNIGGAPPLVQAGVDLDFVKTMFELLELSSKRSEAYSLMVWSLLLEIRICDELTRELYEVNSRVAEDFVARGLPVRSSVRANAYRAAAAPPATAVPLSRGPSRPSRAMRGRGRY